MRLLPRQGERLVGAIHRPQELGFLAHLDEAGEAPVHFPEADQRAVEIAHVLVDGRALFPVLGLVREQGLESPERRARPFRISFRFQRIDQAQHLGQLQVATPRLRLEEGDDRLVLEERLGERERFLARSGAPRTASQRQAASAT